MIKNLKRALLDKKFVELLQKIFSVVENPKKVLTLEDWQKFLETAKVEKATSMVGKYIVNAWLYEAKTSKSMLYKPSKFLYADGAAMLLRHNTLANKIEIGYEYTEEKPIKYFIFYLEEDEILKLKA